MTKIKIFIGKNKNKTQDKHPDLKVAIMTQDENGKTVFVESGALWKSKTGSGYVGEIDTEAKPYVKPETPKDTTTSKGADGEVINADEIPW
jgi:hypothetical protein